MRDRLVYRSFVWGLAGAVALAGLNAFAAFSLPFKRGMNVNGLEGHPYTTVNSWFGDSFCYYLSLASTFTDIKAKGFDHVRLPVDFRNYYDSSTQQLKTSGTYSITYVDEILDRAFAAGLYVTLDFHGWYEIDPKSATDTETFLTIWQLLAERYQNASDKLAFELMNEPNAKYYNPSNPLNTLQANALARIRATNPTRLVLFAIPDRDQPWLIDNVSVPANDSNVGVVVHSYNPGVFTHQGATWADPSYTSQVRLTDEHRATLRWDLNKVKTFMDNHPTVPVVMNEFAVELKVADTNDVQEYLSTVRAFCESNHVPWAYWQYTDRGSKEMGARAAYNGAWRDEVINALLVDEPEEPVVPEEPEEPTEPTDGEKTITITFSGYAGTTALEKFPVLVKLSSSIAGFSAADFKLAKGGDLRFTDAEGKLIPHEIDTWNPDGVSTVWVQVPSLSRTTTITAHYGTTNPGPTASGGVWDADYVGVWHLGESALPLKESSGVSTDFATQSGTGIGYAAEGVVGGAVDFGATGGSRMLDAADDDDLDGFTQCTFEFWTNARERPKEGDKNTGILSKRTGYGKEASYHLFDTGAGTTAYFSSNGKDSIWGCSLETPVGTWQHQAFTFNAGSVGRFLNGTSKGTGTCSVTQINAGASPLHLGNFNAGDARNFPGRIDEVRISKVVRSADWVQASYDTVASPWFADYRVNGAADEDSTLTVNVGMGETATLDATLVTAAIRKIRKIGPGVLVASPIPDYTGDFEIAGGVYQFAAVGDFGCAGQGVVDVRDGASLLLAEEGVNNVLDGKTVNLAGANGPGMNGKIQVAANTPKQKSIGTNLVINLSSDATIFGDRTAMLLWPTCVNLNGHELTVGGSGNWYNMRLGGAFVAGGALTFSNCAWYVEWNDAAPVFSADCAATACVRLRAGAIFNPKKAVPSHGWTFDNVGGHMRGNMQRKPTETNVPLWDGPVVCSGTSTIVSYSGGSSAVSSTVFNVKGSFAGSGTLTCGPGWLNLHNAANTYAGVVKVTDVSTGVTQYPVPRGGGGIGLWNGAACFPMAESVTFNDTSRLAFMDSTACSTPVVVFTCGADEEQSISGGVATARPTMAGFVKTGAGTLVVDSPASVGQGVVSNGTLVVAARDELPVFTTLVLVTGTTLNLSGNASFQVENLEGVPALVQAPSFGVTGRWTRTTAAGVLSTEGALVFAEGATLELDDLEAFEESRAKTCVLAQATGGITGLPRLDSDRWNVRVAAQGTNLVLSRAGGLTFYIR